MHIERLLDLARQHVEKLKAKKPDVPACLTDDDITVYQPDDNDGTTSLESILGMFFNPTEDKLGIRVHSEIIFLEAWLRKPGRARITGSHSSSQTATIIHPLKQTVINTVLPTQPWAERLQIYTAVEKSVVAASDDDGDLARIRSMNVAGLILLSHLERIEPSSSGREGEQLTVSLISCLASFTDLREEWSGQKASEEAHCLLAVLLGSFKAESKSFRSLIGVLLEQHVKPLFAKTKNPAITSQGRKAIGSAPTNYLLSDPESELKPWKFHDVYVVTMFRWILENLDATSMEEHWPLLIPPLLALVDDASTPFKVRGCELLTLFLAKVPSPLLERTGLGEVFQKALMPCLSYLPSLTPENESTAILEVTYVALFALNHRLFPGDKYQLLRIEDFDKVMRNGILKGYAQAGENVRIAELLVKKLTDLVNEMGVDSAKHLKHIIPLLSQVLSAPFATAYPPLLEASVHAIDAVVVNIWPRVAYHRGEILEGLIICWCRIHDEETQSKELQRIQTDIHHTVELVTAILKTNIDVAEEYQALIDSDRRLQNLLLV